MPETGLMAHEQVAGEDVRGHVKVPTGGQL